MMIKSHMNLLFGHHDGKPYEVIGFWNMLFRRRLFKSAWQRHCLAMEKVVTPFHII